MCAVVLPKDLSAEDFWFRTTLFQLPDAVLFRASAPGHSMHRGPKEIALGGDQIMMAVQIAGQVTNVSAGRHHTLSPGDIAFYDQLQGYDSSTTDFDMMALMVARDRVPPLFAAPTVHGAVLPAASGVARLLFRTLETLLDTAEDMTLAELDAAIDAAFVMAGGALRVPLEREGMLGYGAGDAQIDKAMAYIDRNIENPNLTPAHLEEHLRLSRSSLYRLFEPLGGVGAFILRRRLDRGMKALLTGIASKPSLRKIADSYGCRSEAHFSRAFRSRFGIAPRAFLEMVRRKDDDALKAQAQRVGFTTLQGWLKHVSDQKGAR